MKNNMETNMEKQKEKIIIRRDTDSWVMQTYISFGIAILLNAVCVLNLNGEGLERVLIAISLFFLLFTTFTLSKTIRDNQIEQVDTQAWKLMVWIGFGIALSLSSWAIFRMNLNFWHKFSILSSSLFLLSSTFTLSKTIRDKADADFLENKT